jgi:hypothetical protein
MNVRLKYSTTFTAGIFYDSQLLINNYRLTINFTTVSNDPHDQNIALDRIKYFMHRQLESSVFVNSNNQEQCQRLSAAGIRITTLPEEPVDQVVGVMLHCKLNAIVENQMIITETEIASELGENISYLHDNEDQLGPLEVAGWWHELDASHCDQQLIADDNVVAMRSNNSWKDLNLHWHNESVSPDTDPDNKLVFADFQKDDSR